MLGHDIIDLKAHPKRSSQHLQKYWDRICTQQEQQLFQGSIAKPLAIWMAWSIKESVYKLEYQKVPKRYFAPKKIRTLSLEKQEEHFFQGSVKGHYQQYRFQLRQTEDYIHAFACDALINPQLIQFRHFQTGDLPPDQRSKVCTEILIQEVEKKMSLQVLDVLKKPFPVIRLADDTVLNASISHHGEWGSVAFILPQTYSSSSS